MRRLWIITAVLLLCFIALPASAVLGPSQPVIICDATAANCVNITGNALNTNANVTITAPYTTSSSPLTSQQSVTSSATALPSNSGKATCVKVNLAGTQNVYIGGNAVTTATGYELAPGDSACWSVANSNVLYVIASTTGSTVSLTVIP